MDGNETEGEPHLEIQLEIGGLLGRGQGTLWVATARWVRGGGRFLAEGALSGGRSGQTFHQVPVLMSTRLLYPRRASQGGKKRGNASTPHGIGFRG